MNKTAHLLTKDLEFYLAEGKDYSGILDLINMIQTHLPWTKEYFEWQYLNNPAGAARIWVAGYKGQIVATYVAVCHEVTVRGRNFIGWMVQDVMTHPDFRGLGIMHRLAELCNESICTPEFPVNYTFPNERSHNSFPRYGWVTAFRIPLRSVEVSLSRGNRVEEIKGVFSLSEFNEEVEEFWQAIKRDFPFIVSRHVKYLKWRYQKRPGAQYHPFVLRQEGRIRGILVMKHYEKSSEERLAHICDLLVKKEDETGLKVLLEKAHQFAAKGGARHLTAWLPAQHPFEFFYAGAGLKLDEMINRWFLVFADKNNPLTSEVEQSAAWHLSVGDSDIY